MSTPTEADLSANLLLGRLTKHDRARLITHMMAFDMRSGDVIHRAGEDVVDTWFPCGAAMASFCVEASDGKDAVEVAVIGREGAVGGIVSNGQLPAFATAQVRFGGRFIRITTAALEQAKLDSITLRHWFARYSDCLLAQLFQTAACNATHTIVQRTAKWLLAARARTGRDRFELTHAQLALVLGVGRTFVTRTLNNFKDAGLIETTRGQITILDEAALRGRACACTAAIEEHFDAVLSGIYPRDG
ncbi:MAG TPA: Crp/Fnr family transcriptional regulator [Caulobacteraceae bacterium]|nr:Crp/Fnr family transcriptional regulator [Caulobacteraceae bacterium]